MADSRQSNFQEVIEMLVLTRKSAETIKIGDDVVIKVIKTGKGTVKIGIEAPQDIRVIRGELIDVPAPVIAGKTEVTIAEKCVPVSDQYPHVA